MYEQISILGEEIQVANKAKKFESILQELQEIIQRKNEEISYLEEVNKKLNDRNKELEAKNSNPQGVELGAFEISKTNSRPLIHIFVDWIGYEMFVKDCKFDNLPKEKQDVYNEIWNKCIRPNYKEFCNRFANNRVGGS